MSLAPTLGRRSPELLLKDCWGTNTIQTVVADFAGESTPYAVGMDQLVRGGVCRLLCVDGGLRDDQGLQAHLD